MRKSRFSILTFEVAHFSTICYLRAKIKYMEEFNQRLSQFTEMAIEYAPKLLLAIAVLIIGLWIIKRINGIMERAMSRSGIDESIRPFFEIHGKCIAQSIADIQYCEHGRH